MRSTLIKLGVTLVALVGSTVAFASGGGGGGNAGPDKLIVGDSIFALSGDIRSFLEDDLNEDINSVARSGCQVLGGSFICSSRNTIPRQYAGASKRGINTIIMNGGGNDFLLGDGADCTTQACVVEVLTAIEQALADLFADMRADGMDQIIFLGYYDLGDPERDAINAVSVPFKIANYPALGVDYIDSRPAFRGNERRFIGSDGIHPTAAGSRVLADLILQTLD